MSDLSKLQERISIEFGGRDNRLRAAPADGKFYDSAPHSLEEDDLPELVEDRFPALKPALAGAGLLCSAAVLGTGIDAGLYILSAGLALAGVAGAAVLIKDWRAAKAGPAAAVKHARVEAAVDRKWQLSETTELLSTIHDAFGDLAIRREPGGRITQANAAFGRISGWLKPEGMTCEDLGFEFERMPEPHRFRVSISTILGVKVYDWYDVIARDPASQSFMIQSLARDITSQESVSRGSEEALEKAEQASEAKSRLLATVSHEIRTPLSGILGMSHLLGQTRLTAEQSNYLAGMRQSGHALVQLVEDLLDFASIEAGRFQLRPAQEPLRETVESVVEMLSHRAHEKGIEIGATMTADVPALMEFDAARLKQVLFNVIGNAVKFTQQGGVLVAASLETGSIVIRVEDTGPGMSAADQARIFDDFEQAGNPKERAAGTGLGLSISRRIMSAFNGTLTLSSVIGKGSVFEIRFPVARGGSASASADRRNALAASHVLVLAPAGPALTALAATITTLGGTCLCASTPAQAHEIAARALNGSQLLTDIIVDHRHAVDYRRLLAALPQIETLTLRKTYLVNPEERNGRPINQMDGYQAWLIRPLRERSLVEVLCGRMKGMEVRDAINDNRPVLRDRTTQGQISAPIVQDLPVSPSQTQRGGVLLAEDDPINAFMIRSILEKAGHSVRHVCDFKALTSALIETSPAARTAPALVVTDLNMPGGNGLETLRRVRMHELKSGDTFLPIIVLTSDTSGTVHDRLMEAGASAVLTKPADPRTLIAEIDRLLER